MAVMAADSTDDRVRCGWQNMAASASASRGYYPVDSIRPELLPACWPLDRPAELICPSAIVLEFFSLTNC